MTSRARGNVTEELPPSVLSAAVIQPTRKYVEDWRMAVGKPVKRRTKAKSAKAELPGKKVAAGRAKKVKKESATRQQRRAARP
jgi:hypothetical protein